MKHLAQILRSLAELDYDNDVIFDRISQHIMDKLHKADAKAITDLVCLHACTVAGHPCRQSC